jgi:hypothetical protein
VKKKEETGMKQATSNVEFLAYFMLVSCVVYLSTLKMDAIYSSETSDDFHRARPCYFPEDITSQQDTSYKTGGRRTEIQILKSPRSKQE